jgi:chromosome segregation ATPase
MDKLKADADKEIRKHQGTIMELSQDLLQVRKDYNESQKQLLLASKASNADQKKLAKLETERDTLKRKLAAHTAPNKRQAT